MTASLNSSKSFNDSLQPRVVRVEKDLEQLVKRFLKRQEGGLQRMQGALTTGDFETIQRFGHDLKGAGELFGFPELSILGARLELAAEAGDAELLITHIASMERYLERLQLRFD
ncbi:MAG TPA: Hpt domain-containing protein [Burkholderiales bacterium]|nr:Hpt domain-containing protein [Burkholderiales bacterium]